MSDLAGRLDGLSSARRALLARRLKQRRAQQEEGLRPVPRTGKGLPLSFSQERFWLLQQLAPTAAYNDRLALRLRGVLSVQALQQAFLEIVRRHEILRTRFREREGRVVQFVEAQPGLQMEHADLSELPVGEREHEARRRVERLAGIVFDLADRPPLRVLLLRLDHRDHVLVVVVHHILTDGSSRNLLVRELVAHYGAFASGSPSPLPPLSLQFGDFAAWQRRHFTAETVEGELAFWRGALKEAPSILELPTDRPRPPVQSFRGASMATEIGAHPWERVKAVARDEGATPFVVLLASFYALLSRYTGQSRLVVGTPVAGRRRRELAPLLGPLINTLAIAVDVEPQMSFRRLVARVRKAVFAALAHQDLPFERVVQDLEPRRPLDHAPLFQVMFALHPDLLEISLPGLEVTRFPFRIGTSRFDLSSDLEEVGQVLSGRWQYSTDLFEETTVRRFVEQYSRLLATAAADPGCRVGMLPSMSGA
ncbi:MAG: condensation domain-containing protein, partial [bacterium]